jgi:hypothetical protein
MPNLPRGLRLSSTTIVPDAMSETTQRIVDYQERILRDLDAAQRAQSGQSIRFARYSSSGIDMALNYGIGSPAEAQPSRLKRYRDDEKIQLEQFVRTGMSGYKKWIDEESRLVYSGNNMGDTAILFTLDDQKITAQKKRTKHIAPLLTELAQREGLELLFTEEPPEHSLGRTIRYYVFKGEVDDTELVAQNKPTDRIRSQQHEEGFCACDEYCSECHSHECGCEDDEEDEEYPF